MKTADQFAPQNSKKRVAPKLKVTSDKMKIACSINKKSLDTGKPKDVNNPLFNEIIVKNESKESMYDRNSKAETRV